MLSNCGAGEDSWESLGLQETKLVHPKGNQPWIFTGKTDAEAEAPVLWPPDAKSRLTGEDPDSGKNWRTKEKGAAEDEMVGWHHWLNGMSLSKLGGTMKDRDVWYATVHGVTKSRNDLATEQQHTTHPGGENPTYVSMPLWAPTLCCRKTAVLEKAHMGIWVWVEVEGKNG